MRLTNIPKIGQQSVRHESKWPECLPLRDLIDVMSKLLLTFARIARCTFRLDNRDNLAARFV
jgi:hypothetical protein